MELGKITAWLASNRPWAPGVALNKQVGTYLRLFALPETKFSRQALVRELSLLVGQVKEEIVALARTAPAPEVPSPPVGVGSPTLARVRDQLRAVRDERSHTHAQLTARNLGKKARYALADRILALTDQERKLKDLEAHVLEHGRLPGPVPSDEVTDAGVLRQRLANLCSRRSKLKKKPDRAEDLAAAEAEITLIRSKLNP